MFLGSDARFLALHGPDIWLRPPGGLGKASTWGKWQSEQVGHAPGQHLTKSTSQSSRGTSPHHLLPPPEIRAALAFPSAQVGRRLPSPQLTQAPANLLRSRSPLVRLYLKKSSSMSRTKILVLAVTTWYTGFYNRTCSSLTNWHLLFSHLWKQDNCEDNFHKYPCTKKDEVWSQRVY